MTDFEFVANMITVVSQEAGFRDIPRKTRTLLRNSREYYAAKFRDDAIYLARENTQLSYPQLGELFKRDHSTVIAAYRRAKMRRERNPLRKDKRTWVEWHDYLLAKVRACESSKPAV